MKEKNNKNIKSKTENYKTTFCNKMQYSKGITLIALIITIIIMLILVVLSINIAIKSGLFKTAGKATKDTRIEGDKEQKLAGGQVNIDGKIYASIEDYLAGKEMDTRPKIEAGKKATTESIYESNNKKATIPEGFTVSGKTSESTIDGGLVVYLINDKTEEEIEAIDWENEEEVIELRKTYDQFVWVPTPKARINELYICQAKTDSLMEACDIQINKEGELECQTHKEKERRAC